MISPLGVQEDGSRSTLDAHPGSHTYRDAEGRSRRSYGSGKSQKYQGPRGDHSEDHDHIKGLRAEPHDGKF